MVSLMRIEWIRLMKNKKNWIILGLFLAFVLALPFYHNKKNEEAVLRRDSIYESSINYAEIERALIAKEYTDTLEDFDPDTFDEVYPKENQIRQDTWTRDIVFTQKQQLAFGRGEWMEEAKVTLAKDRNMLEGLEGGLIRERNSQTHDIGTVQELDNRIRLNEYLVSHEIMPWKTEYEPAAYPVLFYLLNTVFPLALPILICLLCSDCFATEVESGSIKMWLLMPAARWKIYAAKLMANLLYVLLVLAMILGLGLAAAGLLYGLGDAGYPIRVFYEDGQANLAAGISEITDVTVDYLPISSVVSHILLSDVLFLLVGVDFPDVLQLHAGLDQQIVAHLQAGAADDEEIMLQHQVVDFVHRPGGAVFDGKHAELAHTGFHCLEHMLKALEEHDIRQLEQPLAGQLGERALHALAGYAGALGEQLRGLFQHGLNLLVGAGAAGGLGVLIGPAHRQDGLVHRLGVFRKLFSGLLRHPAQQFPLPGGVLDRELVGLLIRADGFGQLHPAAEQVYKLLVDLVDFFPHLF